MSAREDFRCEWRRRRIMPTPHWTTQERWKNPRKRIADLLQLAAEAQQKRRDDWRFYMARARSTRLSIPSR